MLEKICIIGLGVMVGKLLIEFRDIMVYLTEKIYGYFYNKNKKI